MTISEHEGEGEIARGKESWQKKSGGMRSRGEQMWKDNKKTEKTHETLIKNNNLLMARVLKGNKWDLREKKRKNG